MIEEIFQFKSSETHLNEEFEVESTSLFTMLGDIFQLKSPRINDFWVKADLFISYNIEVYMFVITIYVIFTHYVSSLHKLRITR